MNKIQARRLLKLAKFLREQVSAHVFDFSDLARVEGPPLEHALKSKKFCNTVACAFGWAPARFPRQLTWTTGKYPSVVMRSDRTNTASRFFTEDPLEWDKIFMPGDHGSGLPDDATPNKVASHIEAVVRKTLGDEWYTLASSKL